MYRHMLVPLDGSALATTLVTQAVHFAASVGAQITFFTMREDYAATGDGALARTVAPEAFVDAAAGEANAILAKARAAAGEAGVSCEALVRTGRHPFELILEVARERACDLIFMASHGARGLKGFFLGSQTHKVLSHANIPVLVATVESNVNCPAADRAIGVIIDDHRAIAAVNQGLRRQALSARRGERGDFELVALLVAYLREFPEQLHHPKEETQLFAKLAARTSAFDATLRELTAEHQGAEALLVRIDEALEACRAPGDGSRYVLLADALDALVDAQWHHLGLEEKVILPAAREHLTGEDWDEVAEAFVANGELARGGARDELYRQMFVKLMNQAAEEATR